MEMNASDGNQEHFPVFKNVKAKTSKQVNKNYVKTNLFIAEPCVETPHTNSAAMKVSSSVRFPEHLFASH